MADLKKNLTVIGIDPGIAITGFGIIKEENNSLEHIHHGVIKTPTTISFIERLRQIDLELNYIIKQYQPDVFVCEQLYFAKNVKTALTVGQARGVIMLAAIKNNLEVFEFTPLQIKQALTGYGQATKKQIQEMVKLILGLKKNPTPDDAADALAIAITFLQSKNYLTKIKQS